MSSQEVSSQKNNKKSKKDARWSPFPRNPFYLILLIIMALAGAFFLALMTVVDAFPLNYILYAVAAMFVLLILADILFKRKRRFLRITGILVACVFLLVYGLGSYYLGTTFAMFSRIGGNGSEEITADEVDISKEAFNIYLTGIDQWNKEKGLDLERSDVNMIVTVSPQSKEILLTSIPRDTYIPLHRTGTMDKLTHTGIYGVDETINSVQDWLGIDLNYYVKMNFSAVRDVIDAMGGIDVYSPVAFSSSISNYSYIKGWNHLNGKAALFFARERKSFEGKDDIRVENQQRVVKAVIDKMTSSTTLLTKYGDILSAAGKSLETNMSSKEMQSLVRMQLEDLGSWEITNQKIKGDYDMDYVASMAATNMYQVYRPKKESVDECLAAIKDTMNPTQEEIDARIKEKQRNTAMNFINHLLGRDEPDPEAGPENSNPESNN